MKQFALGDPHGGYKAMLQVFERSGFNKKEDELIVLGDVCDGWPQVKECFDLLVECKHLQYVMGNHDYWAYEWYNTRLGYGVPEIMWISQGGQATIDSYGGITGHMPEEHLKILENAHIGIEQVRNGKKQIFVHGGIDPQKKFEKQDPQNVMWDRELIQNARLKHNSKPNYKYGGYDDIFVGHTTTMWFNKDTLPMHKCNVRNLDTGGGWGGVLTIMDTETKEYWQSDRVKTLYPEERGR